MLAASAAWSPVSAVETSSGGELAQSFWSSRSTAGDAPPLLSAQVPVVGCPVSGMADDEPPPTTPPSTRVLIPQGTAGSLAFFTTDPDARRGVLAPKSWSCHAQSGSDGDILHVVPPDAVQDRQGGYRGPMVRRRFVDGSTSGRFEVARVAARLFPQARAFVERVRSENLDGPEPYAFSPWPADRIQRLSGSVVAYSTPGGAQGLGRSGKPPYGPEETTGVVMYDASGDEPSLVGIDVRLGSRDDLLATAIQTGFLARLRSTGAPLPSPAPVASPVAAPAGGDAAATVRAFYEALGRADGDTASSLVVPERRASGPYAPDSIRRFYASLPEPLRLTSVRSLGVSDVEAHYRYRKGSGAICDGASVATVSRTGAGTFIARIKPLNGC
jgi:hypothetical protein